MILSRGGTQDPAEMYRAFRGRDPIIGPLLESRGSSRWRHEADKPRCSAKATVTSGQLNVEFREPGVEFRTTQIESRETHVEFRTTQIESRETDVEFRTTQIEFRELTLSSGQVNVECPGCHRKC
jgi:hypothetical protein